MWWPTALCFVVLAPGVHSFAPTTLASSRPWTKTATIATTAAKSPTHSEKDLQSTIARLRKDYNDLKQRLQADLTEDVPSFALSDAEELLDTTVKLTEAQRLQQEQVAEEAHAAMEEAIQDLKQVTVLQSQAEREAEYAVDEAAWLESMDTDHAALESMLLAHAAHDLKETDELWQQTQNHRLEALVQEVRAKDLLWFLVQKEENLKALQESHDEKALRRWAEHELPKHESIVQVLRRKLVDHDPLKGSVAF